MMSGMSHPVSVSVEPQIAGRNRLTTAFRLILAIPHLILVGAIGAGFAYQNTSNNTVSAGGETGILGTFAFLLAIVSWFTIVLGGEHIRGIRDYTRFYLRWRVRALAYLMLLEDRYPPFGDAPYPASITIDDPALPRNRATVGFRLLLAVPHFIVLFFVLFAWWLTTAVAWVTILIVARYPRGLYNFGVGALRWVLRVEAYLLLMVDDYPPFTLHS
jgi:Domain of unknown function (DUF4389)